MTLTFDPETRASLYYDQYRFKLVFSLSACKLLSKLDHLNIDTEVARRAAWAPLYPALRYSGRPAPDLGETSVQNLHDMCSRLLSLTHPFKKILYENWVYLYSDSAEDLYSIAGLSYIKYLSAGEAIVSDCAEDVMQLVHPHRKYRVYLKHQMLNVDKVKILKDLLSNNTSVRCTPRFAYYLTQCVNLWITNSNFLEYDNPVDLTMIGLLLPGIIRKTVTLVAK